MAYLSQTWLTLRKLATKPFQKPMDTTHLDEESELHLQYSYASNDVLLPHLIYLRDNMEADNGLEMIVVPKSGQQPITMAVTELTAARMLEKLSEFIARKMREA